MSFPYMSEKNAYRIFNEFYPENPTHTQITKQNATQNTLKRKADNNNLIHSLSTKRRIPASKNIVSPEEAMAIFNTAFPNAPSKQSNTAFPNSPSNQSNTAFQNYTKFNHTRNPATHSHVNSIPAAKSVKFINYNPKKYKNQNILAKSLRKIQKNDQKLINKVLSLNIDSINRYINIIQHLQKLYFTSKPKKSEEEKKFFIKYKLDVLNEIYSNPNEITVLKYYIIYLLLILFHSFIKDPKNPEELKTKIIARLLSHTGYTYSYSKLMKTFEILWSYFEKQSKETRVKNIEQLAEKIKKKTVPENNIISSLKKPLFNIQDEIRVERFRPVYFFPGNKPPYVFYNSPTHPHSTQANAATTSTSKTQ
jgi:hypothetical protein